MKCPKCGYLGFETSDRCRNCGYDFSLSVAVEARPELPLQAVDGAGAPLADLDLSDARRTPAAPGASGLDLDRVIGAAAPSARETARSAVAEARARATPRSSNDALPLFPAAEQDDTPLITTPRPLRPPLAVRRTTPEPQRSRSSAAAPRRSAFDALDQALEEVDVPPVEHQLPAGAPTASRHAGVEVRPAARTARLAAAIFDAVLLAAIDIAVVYLTLALAGLNREAVRVLPIVPLAAFFAILNGGYLVAFVAASGQTLGKMAMGIRVVGDDGRRVDVRGAVLRAAGTGLSLLTAGLGYLPALVSADGRALHDRISGTRVVSAR